jgi:hypothetical protein
LDGSEITAIVESLAGTVEIRLLRRPPWLLRKLCAEGRRPHSNTFPISIEIAGIDNFAGNCAVNSLSMPDGIGQSVSRGVSFVTAGHVNQYPTDMSRLTPAVGVRWYQRPNVVFFPPATANWSFTRRTLIMGIVNVAGFLL